MNIPPPEDPAAAVPCHHGHENTERRPRPPKSFRGRFCTYTHTPVHPPLPILREALFAISPLTVCLRVKTHSFEAHYEAGAA